MAKKCPVCEGEMIELNKNSLYCEKDDLTFNLNKGKVTVKSDDDSKKGKIQELEEAIAVLQQDNETMKEKLFGNKDEDLW